MCHTKTFRFGVWQIVPGVGVGRAVRRASDKRTIPGGTQWTLCQVNTQSSPDTHTHTHIFIQVLQLYTLSVRVWVSGSYDYLCKCVWHKKNKCTFKDHCPAETRRLNRSTTSCVKSIQDFCLQHTNVDSKINLILNFYTQ